MSNAVPVLLSNTSGKSKSMEWTTEKDVALLREMLVSELFTHKKGTVERGKIWDDICDRLNAMTTLEFWIKDKRGVRDRWTLLQSKFKKKMLEEENSSGLDVEDLTEKEVLIEELIAKEEAAAQSVALKKGDRGIAEDARQRAMERLSETRKRMADEGELPEQEKRPRRSTSDVFGFLREKAKVQQQFKEEDLKMKKEEHNLLSQQIQQQQAQQQQVLEIVQQQKMQMQLFHEQAQQQQQQQNQLLMGLFNKLISK